MICRYVSLPGCAAIFLLAGCGGGGDGGGTTVPPVGAATVITSANAPTVAGASVEAALQTGAIGGLTDSGGFVASATGGSVAKLDRAGTAGVISKSLRTGISNVPIGPETSPCAVSGTVTISGEIADPTTLTAGDRIVIDSDNCDDGEGEVVDGLLEFVIDGFTPGTNAEQLVVSVTLTVTDLMITEGEQFTTATGAMTVSIDTTNPPDTEISISGDLFSVTTNDSSETLRNFSTVLTENASVFPVAYTTDASGTVESSRFDGSVTYDTPVVFQGNGEDYPFAGELLVNGANGASVRVIALDSVNVRVEIDLDGDGAVDETIDTTWEELTA